MKTGLNLFMQSENLAQSSTPKILNAAVIVASLGYFVDIYDLLLFGFVRVKSLTDLGFLGQDLTDKGLLMPNLVRNFVTLTHLFELEYADNHQTEHF